MAFDMAPLLPDMMRESKYSEQEKSILNNFHNAASIRINKMFANKICWKATLDTLQGYENVQPDPNVSTIERLYDDVLDDLNIAKKSLKKGDDALINALYVCLLDLFKLKLTDADLKYPTREQFLKEYLGKFDLESEHEKTLLWQTANWMSVLFKMVTARKNTGLTIQVIPKLLEGWDAKYITGSGMKKSTANRVFLLHSEGKTPINHRGKLRQKAIAADADNHEFLPEVRRGKGRPRSAQRKDSSLSPSPVHGKRSRYSRESSKATRLPFSRRGSSSRSDYEDEDEYEDDDSHATSASNTDDAYLRSPPMYSSDTRMQSLAQVALMDSEFDSNSGMDFLREELVEDANDAEFPDLRNSSSSTGPLEVTPVENLPFMKMPLYVRQSSLGLGFGFSKPQLVKERSWTIFEPKEHPATVEAKAEGDEQKEGAVEGGEEEFGFPDMSAVKAEPLISRGKPSLQEITASMRMRGSRAVGCRNGP